MSDAFADLLQLLEEGGFRVWVHHPDCAIWKSVGGSHRCDMGCGPPPDPVADFKRRAAEAQTGVQPEGDPTPGKP